MPDADSHRRETDRPIARIAKIEGRVLYARGAQRRWVEAVVGIPLAAGDRLDTRTGRMRIDLAGGSAVYANRSSVLQLLTARTDSGEAALVKLTRGEVYVVEEVRSEKWGVKSPEGMVESSRHTPHSTLLTQIIVETPDGLVLPAGTRFDVSRRLSATVVVVQEGAVLLRGKRKREPGAGPAAGGEENRVDLRRRTWVGTALRVEAGHRAQLRRGVQPQGPARVDAERIVEWTGELETDLILFADDFQRAPIGRPAPGWHYEEYGGQADQVPDWLVIAMPGGRRALIRAGEGRFKIATVGESDWHNYRVRAHGQGDAYLEVLLYYRSLRENYRAILSRNGLWLCKSHDGIETNFVRLPDGRVVIGADASQALGRRRVSLLPFRFDPAGWYTVEAEAVTGPGGVRIRLRAWPTGTRPPGWMLDYLDRGAAGAPIPSGRPGLIVTNRRSPRTLFDRFTVIRAR